MKIYVVKFTDGSWSPAVQVEALNEEMARAKLMLVLPNAVIHSIEHFGVE